MASFRMRIDESKEYRARALDDAKELFNESTRTGAVMAAIDHSRQDRKAKEELIEYLEAELPAAQLEEVAEILSTSQIQLSAEIETEIQICD